MLWILVTSRMECCVMWCVWCSASVALPVCRNWERNIHDQWMIQRPPLTVSRRCDTTQGCLNVCNDDKSASLSPVSPVSVVWGGREGGREEGGLTAATTDRSQSAWLLRSQLGPAETSGRTSGNYGTHCQINILCTSLSAISVMVGNGVNFSRRKTQFLVGSSSFWLFFSGQKERVSQWGVISEGFITFLPRLRPKNPVKRCGKD